MKKTLFYAFIATVLILSLTACGGQTPAAGSTQTKNTATAAPAATGSAAPSIPEASIPAAAAELAAHLASQIPEVSVSSEDTVSAAYARYLASKSVAYDGLSSAISGNDSIALAATMAMLPIAMVDLTALPLTLLQGSQTDASLAAGFLGLQGFTTESSGNHFKMSYQSDQGTAIWEGDYDQATDSVTCEMTIDGKMSLYMEFVKGTDGYASQYYVNNSDGNSDETFMLIRMISEGEDVAFGLSDTTGEKPESIYGNHPGSFDFAKKCDSYFTYIGGKGETRMDGALSKF